MTETIAYNFSELYYLLRKNEGRIYSDEEVRELPVTNNQHQHYQEWQIRKRSSGQLVKYLSKKGKPMEILEVGCGNGWLSANLSEIPFSSVAGIDIAPEELSQAQRVFNNTDNLEFFNCSMNDEIIKGRQFDIIVFAASIQYFPSLTNVLNDTLNFLKPGGEIHILDSQFYTKSEIDAARQRSSDYYTSLGFPEMSTLYFHHSIEELELFNCNMIYDPHSFINRLKRTRIPFYWICVKANA